MNSLFNSVSQMLDTALLLGMALAAIAAAIIVIILFLTAQRAWQHFRSRQFDARSLKVHGQWREIVRGAIPAEEWRHDSLQCEIIQVIVIQEISASTDKNRPGLQSFLRNSGLLDRCVKQARDGHGWNRRRAMLALGAMRVPEAIAPLAEALDDWQFDTRITAVQSLGRTALLEAAEPLIEMHTLGKLRLPSDPVANALTRCFLEQPEAILSYLRRSAGESRELLARVASGLATPGMVDEMVLLAGDPLPEVRACAARALAVAELPLSIPVLSNLIRDETWFVRLRAVTSLNQIPHPRAIPALIDALRDSNRLVRTRAAAAIAKFEHETLEVLQMVVDSRDRYALRAMISAVELSGGFEKVIAQLTDPTLHDEAAAMLLYALREGSAGLWTTRPADPVTEAVFP
jgi:hypothetical protein